MAIRLSLLDARLIGGWLGPDNASRCGPGCPGAHASDIGRVRIQIGWQVRPAAWKKHNEATWRSGYAADCKSVHPGSIPGVASSLRCAAAEVPLEVPHERSEAGPGFAQFGWQATHPA